MKTNRLITTWLTALTFSIISLQLSTAYAQGTAFTYQGQLQNNGSPASGSYDLAFTLYNTNITGVAIAGPVTNSAVTVTNGLFTTTVDFGPGVFTGASNWLEITVSTNGANNFTTLAPRQQLTPAPYALYAESASGLSGTLLAAQLSSVGNTSGGYGNFFVGPSGNSTTSGSDNTAIGVSALGFTDGSDNTAMGADALGYNGGSDNTAMGFEALFNGYGSYNIGLGFRAGFNFIENESSNIDIGNPGVTGDNNIIRIGSGQSQTFIAGVINGNGGGLTSLNASQLTSIGNTSGGSGNFFVGPSGNSTMSGGFNTAIGAGALLYNTSGQYNTAIGFGALYNNTNGSSNIALGYEAGSNITNTSHNIDIGNAGTNTDSGIIRIGTTGVQTATYLAGTVYANGVALTSDRNAKENFTAVNAREVLAKVASLPVTEWNYKTDSKDVQHIGPMAQDFQAAFQLGTDDKHISVVDEGGVALAAIQGLNQKLNEKDAEIETLKEKAAKVDSLEKRLTELEQVVQSLAANK
jgi:hypothetical protein